MTGTGPDRRTRADVVVVGAGVVGLCAAREAAALGLSVVVCDPEPAGGASFAAAGMLAPTAEARPGEQRLHALAESSAAAWPEFAARLEEQSGVAVGLRQEGALSVAFDPDDLRALAEVVDVQISMGCKAELLGARECRRLEPALSPRVTGGAFNPGDNQVDTRAVLRALLACLDHAGVTMLAESALRLVVQGGRALGVETRTGHLVEAGTVVLAAGCRSGELAGLQPDEVPPVRPVKGQILRLQTNPDEPLLTRTVRAEVQGRHVYLVPRLHGELVVGATMEELGHDTTVTAGAVHDLLRAALAAVPDVAEASLSEATARSRPGTPDNGPLIGHGLTEGLLVATGHFRHGVLLAPATSAALSELMQGRPVSGPAAAFPALRFAAAGPANAAVAGPGHEGTV